MTDSVKTTKDQKQEGRITEAHQQFVDDLVRATNMDDTNRILWKNKMINAHNQRRGHVVIRNWPWPGAAEFTVPFTDKTINKLKSRFVLSLLGNKRWIIAKPQAGIEITEQVREACKKQEIAVNRIFQDKNQGFVKKLTVLMDLMLEKGKFIAKVRSKFNVRTVEKTLFIRDLIQAEVERALRSGQIDPNQPIDFNTIVEGFRAKPKEELYPFLMRKYGFDAEDKDDKNQMNEIIGKFKRKQDEIEFTQREVTQRPDIQPVLNERFLVPKSTMSMQDAPRVTHEFFLSKPQMEQLIKQGVYRLDLDSLESDSTSNTASDLSHQIDTIKAQIEGLSTTSDDKDQIKIWEICAWYKGKPTVFTLLPEEQNKIIRVPHGVPNEFPELENVVWPYIEHDLEHKDGRYYSSRGIPEKVQSVQGILDMTQNNMINRDIINNTPMFLLNKASDLNERKVRFIPGQIIRTTGEGDIRRFDTGQIDISSERIGQIAKAWGEELVGSMDFSFSNAANPGGAKTAREIDASAQNAAILPQLDILLLLETMGEMATMAFSIFKQRFTRPMVIEGTRITKSDLEVTCDFFWNGSIEQSDKQLQENKALNRIQVLMQGLQSTQVINQEDLYNAFFDWLDNAGVNDPDRYITKPAEQAKVEINQLTQQAQQMKQQVVSLDAAANELQKEVLELREEKVVADENLELQILKNKTQIQKEKSKQTAEKK